MQVANAVALYIQGRHLRIVFTKITFLYSHLAQPCVHVGELFEVVVGKVKRGEAGQTSQLLHLGSGGFG